MAMTDPVADMLTRIRNAVRNRSRRVRIPRSKLKLGIARVLKDEGYIHDYREVDDGVQGAIEIDLKYGPDGELVINQIVRRSKPGRRVYAGIKNRKPVLNGLGIAVLSTSKGVLSDREARAEHVGGEVLCEVW
ncbi:MAG: 30S ribosomal protein S8 [Planctomycetota bacterium]|nr:MAG: 30S ribosomal protein S8 [Planctomycetota bacterium]